MRNIFFRYLFLIFLFFCWLIVLPLGLTFLSLLFSVLIIGWFFVIMSFIFTFSAILATVLGLVLVYFNFRNGLGAICLSLAISFFNFGLSFILYRISFDFSRSYKIFYQEIFNWLKTKIREGIENEN